VIADQAVVTAAEVEEAMAAVEEVMEATVEVTEEITMTEITEVVIEEALEDGIEAEEKVDTDVAETIFKKEDPLDATHMTTVIWAAMKDLVEGAVVVDVAVDAAAAAAGAVVDEETVVGRR